MVNKTKLVALGIMTAAAVIGLLWAPLFAGLPGQDENVIPREASKWHIGKGTEYNPIMDYKISTNKMEFSAKLSFISDESGLQMQAEIIDAKSGKQITQRVPISSAYTFEAADDAKPYFVTLDQTVFSVRDIALEDRYLVKQAVWGTIFVGALTKEITVTDHGKTPLQFGAVDAFTVSYNMVDKENKFWIVDNLPLPVKAQVYDEQGNLQYSYELTSLEAPRTPGFSK